MAKEPWRIQKEELVRRYHIMNADAEKGGVVFAGSSLMEMFPVEEWVRELDRPMPPVYNRGVGGYRTEDMLPILDICIFELQPKKVFINIGTNDLSDPNETPESLAERYDRIITEIEARLPNTAIYMMAYYPVNIDAASGNMKKVLAVRTNEKINAANECVKRIAEKHGQKYIDVNAPLKDKQGRLRAEYTLEGMHMNHDGYRAIFGDIVKYILE